MLPARRWINGGQGVDTSLAQDYHVASVAGDPKCEEYNVSHGGD